MLLDWRYWVFATLFMLHCLMLADAASHGAKECRIPRLVEATAEQLQEGLKKGCFDSVDLVKASDFCPITCILYYCAGGMLTITGVHCSNQ